MHDSIPFPAATSLVASLPKVLDPLATSRLARLALAVAERFGLGVECMSAPPPAKGWELALTIGTAQIRLRIDDAGMTWAAPRFFKLAEDYPADRSLLPLLFEAAAGDGFADIEGLLDAPLRVDGLFAETQQTPQRHAAPDLSIVLIDGGTRTPIWLWTSDPSRLPQLQGRFAAATRQKLGFRISAGGRNLPIGHLRRLEAGDVIVSGKSFVPRERCVTLRLSRGLALHGIQIDEDQMMVENRQPGSNPSVRATTPDLGEVNPETASPEAEPTEAGASAEPPVSGAAPDATAGRTADPDRLLSPRDIDAVSVRVDIDIGTTELTVRELRELAPGTVLQLGRPLEAPALLTVNGNMIATADLVDVNGQLGARVLTLAR